MKADLKTDKSSVIKVEKLYKYFEVTEKEKGFAGSIKNIISPKKIKIKALNKVSFSIGEGELVGFIGPNGAGKTTTLKILSGLLYPTSGFVSVLGFNPWDRNPDYLRNISLVMGQKNQLWWDLPAIDTLELNKEIYEISDKEYKQNLSELVEILEVEDLLKTQVRKLSLGQRMRLELVAALLHKPKVLFLDEPTIGLDVIAQSKVRDFIYEYRLKNNATIILTSHNMDDVSDLAKRVVVINRGEIIFDGAINKLVSDFSKEKIIKVYLAKQVDIKKFEKIAKVKRVNYPLVVLSVEREVTAFVAAEILQNFAVADLNIEEEPLEDIIKRVFGGNR
jgi:ABC-2 type transport system ATP-binding protein